MGFESENYLKERISMSRYRRQSFEPFKMTFLCLKNCKFVLLCNVTESLIINGLLHPLEVQGQQHIDWMRVVACTIFPLCWLLPWWCKRGFFHWFKVSVHDGFPLRLWRHCNIPPVCDTGCSLFFVLYVHIGPFWSKNWDWKWTWRQYRSSSNMNICNQETLVWVFIST